MSETAKIVIMTPTFPRTRYRKPIRLDQMRRVVRLMEYAQQIVPLHWVIIEDGATTDEEVDALLCLSKLNGRLDGEPPRYTYLAHGPTRFKGNAQRAFGLNYIMDRFRSVDPVVYMQDDDNLVDPKFYRRMLTIVRCGMWCIHGLGVKDHEGRHHDGAKYLGPIVEDGKIVAWDNIPFFRNRKWPLDMGCFAFRLSALDGLERPYWNPDAGFGGEGPFLSRFLTTKDEVQPIDVETFHVWHNVPLGSDIENELFDRYGVL